MSIISILCLVMILLDYAEICTKGAYRNFLFFESKKRIKRKQTENDMYTSNGVILGYKEYARKRRIPKPEVNIPRRISNIPPHMSKFIDDFMTKEKIREAVNQSCEDIPFEEIPNNNNQKQLPC